jgi:hypothetical protein
LPPLGHRWRYPGKKRCSHDGIVMQEYKKRLRILAERFGLSVEYDFDGGLSLIGDRFTISFSPTSKSSMNCTVTTTESSRTFDLLKQYAFDVVYQLCTGRNLVTYQPKGNPLTLQEYLDEEDAVDRFETWKNRLANGHHDNIELGGDHYNVQYYNGILIVYDIFVGTPTNVYEYAAMQKPG